jgi:hypothetical protein
MMYERLTRKTESDINFTYIPLNESHLIIKQNYPEQCYTGKIVDHLAAYEDGGLSPEKVQELAKAKAEGRLVVLPVPIGGEYYIIRWNKTVCGPLPVYSWNVLLISEKIGKETFLTREAAEKALEGGGQKG